MQMFFLKNLVGVSTAALLFAGISFSTMAEQELSTQESAKLPDGNLLSPMPKAAELEHGHMPPEDAAAMAAAPSEDLHVELYEKEVEIESNPLSQELAETPEKRVEDRLDALNNAEGGMETMDTSKEPTEPNMPASQEGMLSNQQDNAKELNRNTVSDSSPLTTEGELLIPSHGTDHIDQTPELTQDSTDDTAVTPIQSPMVPKIIKPQLVAWDDEESRPKPKKEDSDDPTSEGQSKHGKHKGLKMTDPRMIPIIRMGENLTQDSSIAIIKSWKN